MQKIQSALFCCTLRNLTSRRWVGLFIGLVLALSSHTVARAAQSQNVSLAWDASPDTNVAGYAVYYGTTSGSHPTRVDVGKSTTTIIPGLIDGSNYFFVVTAYDATGLESEPSNEIASMLPGNLLTLLPGKSTDPLHIRFPVTASHSYELQASDKVGGAWTTVWTTPTVTTNSWLQYDDPKTNKTGMRIYRLILH